MDSRIRTIVVGVAAMHDEDPRLAPAGEDPVLAPAVMLAQQLGARLHVVHTFESADPVRSAYTHALHGEEALRQLRAGVEHQLSEQVRRFTYANIECHALGGAPHRRLCDLAVDFGADLLIVGATRRGWIWSNLLGGTAERVLRRASVPVLVLRRPIEPDAHRVLFTTDLSPVSSAVIEVGLEVVEALFAGPGVEFRSLLVFGYSSTMLRHIPPESKAGDAVRKHSQFLAQLESRGRVLKPKLRWGNPSTEIVRDAGEWHADLVVLGTHSRLGTSRWLLGSTAAAALRGISCNALVIPSRVAMKRHRAPLAREPNVGGAFLDTEEKPNGSGPRLLRT